MAVWSVAFAAAWLVVGLPIDPLYMFVWLWALAVAWRINSPWRVHLAFARDWLPVVGLLLLYALSRGFADNYTQPHVTELIDADVLMFGWLTDGQIPTIWLQEHLFDRSGTRWWDVLVSWVYFSHFVVALTAASVLWLRSRGQWGAFMRRWLFLTVLGLITYFAYPAAPPWWAAERGYLAEEVVRLSSRGWSSLGLHAAGDMVTLGQVASNPVAAMPSLHTAWALFVVLFFLPATRRRWWPLLLAYPAAMTFTLVYAGEHYVIDVLVGWAYVGVTLVAVSALERAWQRRADRHRRSALPAPATGTPPASAPRAAGTQRTSGSDQAPAVHAPMAGAPAGRIRR